MPLDPDRIQKSIRKLRKLVKKAPKRLTPEQVHDLRTLTRSLEAAVDALGLNSKRNERRLLRELARVRKRAGKVRDMDVLTGHTSSLHVDKEQDCLVQLLEYLGSARYRHAKELSMVLREDGPALRRHLKRSSAYFQKVIRLPARAPMARISLINGLRRQAKRRRPRSNLLKTSKISPH